MKYYMNKTVNDSFEDAIEKVTEQEPTEEPEELFIYTPFTWPINLDLIAPGFSVGKVLTLGHPTTKDFLTLTEWFGYEDNKPENMQELRVLISRFQLEVLMDIESSDGVFGPRNRDSAKQIVEDINKAMGKLPPEATDVFLMNPKQGFFRQYDHSKDEWTDYNVHDSGVSGLTLGS